MKSKLSDDLPDLVAHNIISEETSLKIQAYFDSKHVDAPNRLFMVFGVLGALLIGLGVILILAHNWDYFPRSLKTLLAFLPLIIGQGLVGYTILKKKSVTWREASGTFLFFAVGSSIALVSQIYNIPGDLSAYVLTWVVLCMPLIYLLKSHAVAILHLVFSTFYASSLGYDGFGVAPWYYLLLLAIVLPYYINLLKHQPQSNRVSIFNWLLPLSVIITLGTFLQEHGEMGYVMYVILFGIFYNIGRLPQFAVQKLRRNGYVVLGSVGTVVMLLIMSFNGVWDFEWDAALFASHEFLMAIVVYAIGLALLIYLHKKRLVQYINLFHYVFIIFVIVFFSGMGNNVVATVIVNLLVLALGLITIKFGADKLHFGILNYGLVILTALIVSRFFDTDMSFAIRGLLFVVVGIGFFATNYVMLKKKKATGTPKL